MRIRIRSVGTVMSPQRSIAAAFASAILIGTLLLSLPWAHTDGRWHLDADIVFLSTSAVCVTGLDPVGIGTELSFFGICVLLMLVQLGGIGIMTVGTFFFVFMGRRLSVSEERAVIASLGENSVGNVVPMLKKTLVFTFSWELIGALFIAYILAEMHGYEPNHALGHGLFISIMSFCNAGFGLFPDSLCRYSENPVLMLLVSLFVIAGGTGFVVHSNVLSLRPWKKSLSERGRLTLHSKIVLASSAALIAVCTMLYLLIEWNGAFSHLSWRDKLVGAFFHSVTSRTAGFAGVSTESLSPASQILTMAEMFIGAAPGSTGGGIKLTTAAVIVATVCSMLKNRSETEMFGRTVQERTVREAVAITVLSLSIVAAAVFVLSVTEPVDKTGAGILRLSFEAVSAYATCGLSAGSTSSLTVPGKLVVSLLMFIGRLGPMTLAMTMARAGASTPKRYPEENVLVG